MNDQMRDRLRDQIRTMNKRLEEIIELEADEATPESERPVLLAERGRLTARAGDMEKMLSLAN